MWIFLSQFAFSARHLLVWGLSPFSPDLGSSVVFFSSGKLEFNCEEQTIESGNEASRRIVSHSFHDAFFIDSSVHEDKHNAKCLLIWQLS
jgi:hypothetical protein